MALRARCPVIPPLCPGPGLWPGGTRLGERGREGRGGRCPSARHARPAANERPRGVPGAGHGVEHICLHRDTHGCASAHLSHRSHILGTMQLGSGWDSQNPTPQHREQCFVPAVESCPVIDSERSGEPAEARWPGARARGRVGNGSGSEQEEGCWQKFKESRSLLNVNGLLMQLCLDCPPCPIFAK